ncbi:hypothetical protein BC938DRAFT_473978 [Jimgerdemannia flammicorona]|uniref:Ankyrin repeat-containing domain protein n=1 Tax=Jimgerdemannia flammicorona TaxID=994334 RepID=A0A433QSX8_9FUNG|nr:hypothetical protein BC938DRAFT_473978 [Jimgerdemannia flammicorona]
MLNDNVAMLLVSKGTDLHAIKDLPLVWAASRGHCTLFARLLDAQAPETDRMIPENAHQSHLNFPWAASILGWYTSLYSMSPYPREIIGLSEASPPAKPLDFALHAACAAGMDHIVRQIVDQSRIPLCPPRQHGRRPRQGN